MFSLIYGYASYTYPLLPFERNMSFLPNTMPMVLAALGVLLALVIIFTPKPAEDGEGDVLGSIDLSHFKEYKIGQALSLIGAMILYAVALRPIGFIAATTLFLFGAGWILGERRPVFMISIALFSAGVIWLLVQEVLGIFLRPLPWFLGQ